MAATEPAAGAGLALLVAGLCLAMAGEAAAQTGSCADAAAGWSGFERQAWDALAAGTPFDAAAAARAAAVAGDAAAEPVLSAAFLRDVLTCDRLAQRLPDGLVALRAARIAGTLDLSYGTVGVRFDCERCLFDAIDAVESRWAGTVRLQRAKLRGDLDLAFARLDSSLLLDDVEIDGALFLSSATIGGDLAIGGASAMAAIAADSLVVSRSLRIAGADIGVYADFWGAEVTRDVVFDRNDAGAGTVIGSAVPVESLRDLAADAAPALSLGSARINRRISISHTRVNGRLDMDAVRVAEDLWLRNCSLVVGPTRLVFARIGQNIDLSSSVLGDVDLTGARVEGELRLGAPSGRLTAPVWQPGAALTLRNVGLSSWTDATGNPTPRSPDCPPVPLAPDPWPARIDVIGFSYENVEGLGGGARATRHDVDWFCRWLERQSPYSFEPYQHAAAYLRRVGLDQDAEDVLYCGKVLQIDHAESWTGRFVLQVQRAFVGFGYKVERSLIWALIFIVVGQQVFSRAPEAKANHMPYGLAYSVDMFVPGLSLRGRHHDIDLAGWQRYYFYLHKFMGWVLGSFVVATFLGLLGD